MNKCIVLKLKILHFFSFQKQIFSNERINSFKIIFWIFVFLFFLVHGGESNEIKALTNDDVESLKTVAKKLDSLKFQLASRGYSDLYEKATKVLNKFSSNMFELVDEQSQEILRNNKNTGFFYYNILYKNIHDETKS